MTFEELEKATDLKDEFNTISAIIEDAEEEKEINRKLIVSVGQYTHVIDFELFDKFIIKMNLLKEEIKKEIDEI